MQDILAKLSSYNLFNYLLPGIIFVVLSSKLTRFSFIHEDIVIGVFLYYFIGLVISRFGSLVIEPVLKLIKFLNFTDYKDFVSISKEDEKLEVLSEVNNMYRTLCSLLISLILLKVYEELEICLPILREWNTIILLFGLLLMFLLSYRKQTNYITRRIKANK